jgi:hypothetical protein
METVHGSLSPMQILQNNLFRILVLGAFIITAAPAQDQQGPRINAPAASPASTLKQRVGFTDVEVVYARPGMKGRKIFGGLLPYGEVWRTGANAATKVTFSTPFRIAGTELPAGSYALYSIPGPREWTVIFNKVTGDWGAYSYKQENDALRVKAKPVSLALPVETFTIDINDVRTESATLNLVWEKTRVPVKFEVDVIKSTVAQIDAIMSSGQTLSPQVYYTAAMFYFDHGLDLQKAKTWAEKATKGEKPPFFMLHGKAKILAKLGDKAGATEAARKSIEVAQAQGGAVATEYKRLNESLLATLK